MFLGSSYTFRLSGHSTPELLRKTLCSVLLYIIVDCFLLCFTLLDFLVLILIYNMTDTTEENSCSKYSPTCIFSISFSFSFIFFFTWESKSCSDRTFGQPYFSDTLGLNFQMWIHKHAVFGQFGQTDIFDS